MTKIVGPKGSGRRRRFSITALLAAMALFTVFAVTSAQGVHDEGVFQLEMSRSSFEPPVV